MKQKEEFITEEKVINTPAGGVLIGKDKEGQTIIPNDGSLGGFLIGRLHKDGGIKAINKGTGQPLEMQSNEIVITAPAVADTTKHNFNGQMMTNREILSKINSDGGGVSFADGGDIPAKIHTTDKEYEYGGKMVHDSDIANSLGMNSTLKKGKQHFSSGGKNYDVDAIYNAIKKGKIKYKTKEVPTFAMKYPVYDKQYSETVKTDFRKPNGITVRTENGEEVLIDGNHRMNNAYLKGKKTMKTYYIEDPKQIAKFTKNSKFEIAFENGGKFDANPFLNYYFEDIKDFFKYQNNIVLKTDFTFFYRGENFTIEPIILFEDQKEESVQTAIFTIIDQDDEEVGEIKFDANSKEKKKFEAYSDFFEWSPIRFEGGGNLKSQHNHSDNLAKDAEKGNTPARDLNNYNDLLDVQADGAVGGDSGIYADGGAVALPKVAYVKISNAGTSLFDLIGSKYYSFKEFAQGIKQAYVALNKTVRSYLVLESFDENDKKLSNTSTYLSNQKNTVKNFNPLTGSYKNLEKSLSNSNPRAFKKEDWQDWFLSKVTQPTVSSTSSNLPLDLSNTKVWIGDNKTLSKEIQEVAFEMGWTWAGCKTVKNTHGDSLYFDKIKSITYNINDRKYFDESDKKEINPQDILLAKKPVITTTSNASTSVKPFDFTDTKIDVSNNSELSLKVQKRAFELGWEWESGGGKTLSYNPINYLYFTKKSILDGFTSTSFLNSPKREITEGDIFGNASVSNKENVESVLVTFAGGQLYNALDEERLFDKIVELWKTGGRSKMSIILAPQGISTSLSEPFNLVLDTIKTSKSSIQPSTLTIKELREYLSKDWYPELEWSSFFKIQVTSTTTSKHPDYYQFSGKNSVFTNGKIYKIQNPEDIEEKGNFIDDNGVKNGFGSRNVNYFTPSTEEAFLAQQSGVATSKVDDGKIESFQIESKDASLSGFQVDNVYQLFKLLETIKKYNSTILFKYKTTKGKQKKFGAYFREESTDYYILKRAGFNIQYLEEKLNEWFPNLISDSFFETQKKPLLTNLGGTKIRIVDSEMLRKVLKRAVELGWDEKDYENIEQAPFIYFYSDKSVANSFSKTIFEESVFKEIFADDLFESANQTNGLKKERVNTITAKNGDNRGTFYDIHQLKTFLESIADDNKDSLVKGSGSNMKFYLAINDRVQKYDFIINIGNDVSCSTCYDVLTDGIEKIKEIILAWDEDKKWDWSSFFTDGRKTSNPVEPKNDNNKKITDLKEAVNELEGFASKASKKYNTTNYEDNLQLLKEVKEEYSLALSFTPESSFMYERIELMKKISDIQKEITQITELKNGGAYYILAKVLDRLEKGENWKELGVGEIMINEVPEDEIESVIYTEKLKNWFGDWEQALITKEYDYVSKALTESGKPCVMYHGAKRIKFSYRQVSNGVVYLAENRSYAEWFSANESPFQKQGDYLTQCFVNIKNPIDLTVFGVKEVDLRDIIQFIDAVYPLAKIYDVLPPNTAMAIMNNQLIGRNFRAWYIIRQFPELNKHIRDNTNYDGFIYYENNPSDMIINNVTGEMEENVTKATAVFNSNQVKLVDAMLFNSSLDDWRFEQGGNVN
jgi:hypothetical protein